MLKAVVACGVLLGLLFSPVTLRAELRQDLAEAYRLAHDVTYEESPALHLYDALSVLSEKPESNADLLRVIDAAKTPETDAALRPGLSAMEVLYHARLGDMTAYKKTATALRNKTRDPQLLQLIDVTDILKTCGTCRDRLICKTCKGTYTCPTCKGRGSVSVRTTPTSNANMLTGGGSSKKVTCSACRGAKRCPTCKGEPKTCATCNSTGKHPDEAKLASRIKTLAQALQKLLHEHIASELLAREQTLLLAEELKRAEAMPEVEDALHLFASLPQERFHARQWPQAQHCRSVLESIKEAFGAEAVARERERTLLRTAIRNAQRADDPLKGLDLLGDAIKRHADCDTLNEAMSAYDGLILAYLQQQQLRFDTLVERKNLILSLNAPEERIAQLEATLADWDDLAPKSLPRKYQPFGEPGLQGNINAEQVEELKRELEQRLSSTQATVKDNALRNAAAETKLSAEQAAQRAQIDDLRQELEQLLASAQAAQVAQAEKTATWWKWPVMIVGGLLLLLGLMSGLQSLRARREEEARRARERAVLDSIHKTFSHRRH